MPAQSSCEGPMLTAWSFTAFRNWGALLLEGRPALGRVRVAKQIVCRSRSYSIALSSGMRNRRLEVGLRRFRRDGAREAMISAIRAGTFQRSVVGTTSLTSPQASALSAGIGSPVIQHERGISRRLWNASDVPPCRPPPIHPSLISGAANCAFSEAIGFRRTGRFPGRHRRHSRSPRRSSA